MRDILERMGRSLSNLPGIGRITANTNETMATPTTQVALPGGNMRSDLPLLQDYGFASRPVPGSDATVIFQSGDRSRGVIVATGDQRNRPTDLQPGEVCLYHPQTKSRIWLKADGSIELAPANGKITMTGTLTVTEDVVANGISVVNHVHTGVQTGSGQSGPPKAV